MALLAVQDGSAGIPPTFAAATGGGDTIAAGASSGGWRRPVVLIVKNLDAATKTVTVAGKTPVVVPATSGIGIIPIDSGNMGDVIGVTYSAVTSVTVAAVSF